MISLTCLVIKHKIKTIQAKRFIIILRLAIFPFLQKSAHLNCVVLVLSVQNDWVKCTNKILPRYTGEHTHKHTTVYELIMALLPNCALKTYIDPWSSAENLIYWSAAAAGFAVPREGFRYSQRNLNWDSESSGLLRESEEL